MSRRVFATTWRAGGAENKTIASPTATTSATKSRLEPGLDLDREQSNGRR